MNGGMEEMKHLHPPEKKPYKIPKTTVPATPVAANIRYMRPPERIVQGIITTTNRNVHSLNAMEPSEHTIEGTKIITQEIWDCPSKQRGRIHNRNLNVVRNPKLPPEGNKVDLRRRRQVSLEGRATPQTAASRRLERYISP